MNKTIGEEIDEWTKEYDEGSVISKYLLHTLLMVDQFKVEKKIEWLKTQKEVTKEEYHKAMLQQ